jgi:D-alanine-D-alanine ligase
MSPASSAGAPPGRRLRVGVLYGGRSGEHEVSLASAAAVVANLPPDKYEAVPILIERDGRWRLPAEPPRALSAAETIGQARQRDARAAERPEVHLLPRPGVTALRVVSGGQAPAGAPLPPAELDVVFPVLHGPYGEDGTVQGLLELANLPYVGAGVAASAVGMDKVLQKELFRAAGLPVVDYRLVWRRDILADAARVAAALLDAVPLPVFVKPVNLGSSVGISKVKTAAALADALRLAADFDRKVIVERAVADAREIECAVLGNDAPEVSVPGEIVPAGEFYDYEAKYLSEGSQLLIPAPLTEAESIEVRRLSLSAFRAIDASGMARVDFLVSRSSGAIVLNEVNTIPGFTAISMYAKLWAASGVPYATLLDRLVELALERHREKQALRTTAH